MNHTKKTFIQIFFIICLTLLKSQADALDLSLESAIGYNDNVPKISEKQGSGFSLYQVNISQPLKLNISTLETSIFAQGAYNDYFRVRDNYYLNAGAAFSLPLYNARIIPGIFSDILVFRDNFLEKDSKNELSAGISAQWILSARTTLGIRQTWQWSDYIEDTAPFPGFSPHNENTAENKYKMDKQPGPADNLLESRDDRIQTTGIEGIYYFSPELHADFLAEHTRVDSSIDIESYKENKISGYLVKTISSLWEFSLAGSFGHSDYKSIPGRNDRQDTTWNTQIRCTYFIKSLELRFQYQWEYNDSDEINESYHQQVTQCGLIFSF
ncbi:Uncharacterized protein dnl_45610 [Desulfonema limicola]|uniref:Uncharacterized protein n=1 Tax=Desulfonema limicola TaxID=45656 RepID=A0A975BBI0_9BACT|nr:hypothetical protein [Desulfonema limicola]QTA82190.1 Uncharacterized protein dnl_45610 [Desulfonema limicola]